MIICNLTGILLEISYPASVFNLVLIGSVKRRQSFEKGPSINEADLLINSQAARKFKTLQDGIRLMRTQRGLRC